MKTLTALTEIWYPFSVKREAGDTFECRDEDAVILCARDIPGGPKAELAETAPPKVEPPKAEPPPPVLEPPPPEPVPVPMTAEAGPAEISPTEPERRRFVRRRTSE